MFSNKRSLILLAILVVVPGSAIEIEGFASVGYGEVAMSKWTLDADNLTIEVWESYATVHDGGIAHRAPALGTIKYLYNNVHLVGYDRIIDAEVLFGLWPQNATIVAVEAPGDWVVATENEYLETERAYARIRTHAITAPCANYSSSHVFTVEGDFLITIFGQTIEGVSNEGRVRGISGVDSLHYPVTGLWSGSVWRTLDLYVVGGKLSYESAAMDGGRLWAADESICSSAQVEGELEGVANNTLMVSEGGSTAAPPNSAAGLPVAGVASKAPVGAETIILLAGLAIGFVLGALLIVRFFDAQLSAAMHRSLGARQVFKAKFFIALRVAFGRRGSIADLVELGDAHAVGGSSKRAMQSWLRAEYLMLVEGVEPEVLAEVRYRIAAAAADVRYMERALEYFGLCLRFNHAFLRRAQLDGGAIKVLAQAF